ncbi:MAG: FmdB family zinc ribbon protein [Bryobacteraceae bacterium]
MPIYEYKCASCGEVFELIQKFTDEPLRNHETCGGAVERLISASALQFKGSGWYVNDYARSNGDPKKSEKSEKSEGSGDKPAAETKEAKTEAKKEPAKASESKPAETK